MSPYELMLVTSPLETQPTGGRSMLSKLNYDLLREIYGSKLLLFELPKANLRGTLCRLNAFRGHIDGISQISISLILSSIKVNAIRRVFLDGSNLGTLARAIKREFPSVEVIIFFHNVESRFFWGAYRLKKNLRTIGITLANYIAERNAVYSSDKRICLNERDSEVLGRLYGQTATHIAPLIVSDRPKDQGLKKEIGSDERFALFVGGSFYANISGIMWYARHVAPQVEVPVYVIGRGFEDLKHQIEVPGKLKVIGAVEHLAAWYEQALFVVAPIFDGSGMKTKVAEALMYGKRVIGTPEAFCGYERVSQTAGWVCQDAQEFAAAMAYAYRLNLPVFDPHLAELFETHYSFRAGLARLRHILDR